MRLLILSALLLLLLSPALAAAEPRPLRAATTSIEAALTRTRKGSEDCQTILTGNLQTAKGMVDRLKLDWTPQGAKQAADWLNTTAAAGGLGGCPGELLDLIRRAASQVADSGEEAAAPRLPAAGASPCGGISALAREWDALGDYLEEHEGGRLGPLQISHVAQEERRLTGRTIQLVRAAMGASKRFQRLGARLLGLLLQLDGIDDDNDWSADIALMLRIVKTIDKISGECGAYF